MTGEPHPGCQCVTTTHVHGSYLTLLKHGCKCEDCRADRNRRAMRHQTRHRMKISDARVPVGPARAHVRKLAKHMTLSQIADAADTSVTTVQTVKRSGTRAKKTVSASVEAKLLAIPVPVTRALSSSRVDVTGTRRRIQALHVLGYSARRLALMIDVHENTLRELTGDESEIGPCAARYVTVETRDKITALYDQLWDQPFEPSTPHEQRSADGARKRARRFGWVPPVIWDDDRIDDPHYRPQRSLVLHDEDAA